MSYSHIHHAWQQDLKPSAKLVLLCLANRADESGKAFPSVARIEQDTGLDRKTVLKALACLEGKGLIVDTKERAGRTKSVTVYRLGPVPGFREASPLLGQVKPEAVQEQGQDARESSPKFPGKVSHFSAEAIPFFRGSSPKNGTQNRPVTNQEPTTEHGGRVVVFPPGIDQQAASRMLETVESQDRQAILDTLAVELRGGAVRKPLAFLGGLIRRYLAGQFDGSAGEVERRRREAPAYKPREVSTNEVLAEHARMAGQSLDAYLAKLKMRRH